MLRKVILMLFVVVFSLAVAMPILSDAPAGGVVTEGDSVPGIALGYTRAQVEAAYGEPQWCQNNYAYCSFPVSGGGQVDVQYREEEGGDADNLLDDVVYNMRWSEQVDGWTTTAGVNTMLAKDDPEAVVAAYPDAQVTYNQWGDIYSVVDHEQGIEVIWALDLYRGTTHVSMAIFFPRTPPPPREKLVLVTEIDLRSSKKKGNRQVRAWVRVQDDRSLAASGATVFAKWSYSDGSPQTTAQSIASGSGYAYFEINNAQRGTYTLSIDDVELDDHEFDGGNSVLSASIKVK